MKKQVKNTCFSIVYNWKTDTRVSSECQVLENIFDPF
jgi:hypothetical protein